MRKIEEDLKAVIGHIPETNKGKSLDNKLKAIVSIFPLLFWLTVLHCNFFR